VKKLTVRKNPVCLLFVIAVCCSVNPCALYPQSTNAEAMRKSVEFPQWAKDLRRFDVVTFGVFPFAWLLTSVAWDFYRSSQHDWDSAYMPFASNAEAWVNNDYKAVLGITAGLSLTVALVDFVIVKVKRSRAEKRARALVPNEPDIKRTPLDSGG